jgi:sphinganine-1-phosphate aldolase
MQSSKGGGLLAAAWAVMRHLGADGYLDLVRATMSATTELIDGVREIDGLRVLGTPAASLVAITTSGLDFFAFLDELEGLGWPIQPQLSQPGVPAAIHLTVTATHGKYIPDLLAALGEAAAAARTRAPLPSPEQLAKVSDLPEDAPPDQLFGLVGEALAEAGGRMAPIHALLDSLPPKLQESALLAFFEGLNPPL